MKKIKIMKICKKNGKIFIHIISNPSILIKYFFNINSVKINNLFQIFISKYKLDILLNFLFITYKY